MPRNPRRAELGARDLAPIDGTLYAEDRPYPAAGLFERNRVIRFGDDAAGQATRRRVRVPANNLADGGGDRVAQDSPENDEQIARLVVVLVEIDVESHGFVRHACPLIFAIIEPGTASVSPGETRVSRVGSGREGVWSQPTKGVSPNCLVRRPCQFAPI